MFTINHTNLLSVEQHAVDPLDGVVGRLLSLEVDEAVAPGGAVGIRGHLAREDAANGAEGVVQGLVVDGLVQDLLNL